MAQTPNQIPSSTNETNNYPHQNGLQQTPPDAPRNQQNNNCLPPIHTTDELQVCAVRSTNERQDTSQPAVSQDDQEFFKEHRGWLMIVAILAAGSTYQAGLSPPGSFWQDDVHGHVPGNPILADEHFNRYQAFFYCNAISFLSSLVIIILLMNQDFFSDNMKIKVLKTTMVLDLLSFMAAYAVGSCRRKRSSIYIFLIMIGVFVCVITFALYYSELRSIAVRARLYLNSLYIKVWRREARLVRPAGGLTF